MISAVAIATASAAGACTSEPPPPPTVLEARPADAFGMLEPASGDVVERGDGTIGPSHIRVEGLIHELPSDLHLDDAVCGYVTVPGNGVAGHPCWAQLGLSDDGRTIEWIESSFAPREGGTREVVAQGTVATIDADQIVLDDRTTIGLGPSFTWTCSPTQTAPAVGLRVMVTVDTATNLALDAGCGPHDL